MMDKKPYAYVWGNSSIDFQPSGEPDDTPLYLNTPWIGLTDAEIHNADGYTETRETYRLARAIEALLKEKNK